jgi:hypothetical protein
VVYIGFSHDVTKYPDLTATTALFLRSMLIVLIFLITFWTNLIIKAAMNQACNRRNVEDIREDEFQEKKKMARPVDYSMIQDSRDP